MTAPKTRAPKARLPVPSEAQVLRGVLAYLEHDHRVLVWRQNTGVAKYEGEGGKARIVRFNVPGAADITGMLRGSGRRLEVEVKKPGGTQTAEQKAFQRAVEAAGGVYLVVRSIDDCVQALAQLCPRATT